MVKISEEVSRAVVAALNKIPELAGRPAVVERVARVVLEAAVPLIAAQVLRQAAEAKRRLYARLTASAPLLDWPRYKADIQRLDLALAGNCPTCSGPQRETVGMVCQTCGTDYAPDAS